MRRRQRSTRSWQRIFGNTDNNWFGFALHPLRVRLDGPMVRRDRRNPAYYRHFCAGIGEQASVRAHRRGSWPDPN
eukprot:12904770-Prorocentrum_lima.AAC.1